MVGLLRWVFMVKKRRKAVIGPDRSVYFRCKNENCGFVGSGVTNRPYIRCSRCNQWSSIWKHSISREEYDRVWGRG